MSLRSSPVKAFDLPSQLLARVQPKLFARSRGGLRPFLDEESGPSLYSSSRGLAVRVNYSPTAQVAPTLDAAGATPAGV